MYKHLSTLRNLGYIRKRDGQYEISYELYTLGDRVRLKEPLYEVSRTPLDQLARITYTRSNLYVREGERAVCLYSTSGGQDLSTKSAEGKVIALNDSVTGRVMLSHDESEERRRSEVDRLEGSLTVVDDHQIGIERERGHRRIAIAVIGSDQAKGSIEVVAPTDQIEGRLVDEDILSMMVSTAETIEDHL
jgi:DNA-binding IclR family transcriptional regulator